MSFPVVAGFGGGNSGGNVTTTTVDLMVAGTPRVGDLLLVLFALDGDTEPTWPAGWQTSSAAMGASQGYTSFGARVFRSGDPTSIDLSHPSEGSAWQVYRITGAYKAEPKLSITVAYTGIVVDGGANGTNSAPDPANAVPDWPQGETLWIAFAGHDNGTVSTDSGPSSYANFRNDRWNNVDGVGLASARRELDASSENPGTFALSASEEWRAQTIAIRAPSNFPNFTHGSSNWWGNVRTSNVDVAARVGTPDAGDLVIISICKYGTGAFTWPASPAFTQCPNFPRTAGGGSNQAVVDSRFRVWQAGDSTTVSITHANETTVWLVYRVAAGTFDSATAPAAQTSDGNSTNPDPPNLDPAGWVTEKTLWIAVAGNDGNVQSTAGPSGYSFYIRDYVATAGGVHLAGAVKESEASSEDPGVFTMASEQWAAGTIAVRPRQVTIPEWSPKTTPTPPLEVEQGRRISERVRGAIQPFVTEPTVAAVAGRAAALAFAAAAFFSSSNAPIADRAAAIASSRAAEASVSIVGVAERALAVASSRDAPPSASSSPVADRAGASVHARAPPASTSSSLIVDRAGAIGSTRAAEASISTFAIAERAAALAPSRDAPPSASSSPVAGRAEAAAAARSAGSTSTNTWETPAVVIQPAPPPERIVRKSKITAPPTIAEVSVTPAAGRAPAAGSAHEAGASASTNAAAGRAPAVAATREAGASTSSAPFADRANASGDARQAAASTSTIASAGRAGVSGDAHQAAGSASSSPIAGRAVASADARAATASASTTTAAGRASASADARPATASASSSPLAGRAGASADTRAATASASSSPLAGRAPAAAAAREVEVVSGTAAAADRASAAVNARPAEAQASSSPLAERAAAVANARPAAASISREAPADRAATSADARAATASASSASLASRAAASADARAAAIASSSAPDAGRAAVVSNAREAQASSSSVAMAGRAGGVASAREATPSSSSPPLSAIPGPSRPPLPGRRAPRSHLPPGAPRLSQRPGTSPPAPHPRLSWDGPRRALSPERQRSRAHPLSPLAAPFRWLKPAQLRPLRPHSPRLIAPEPSRRLRRRTSPVHRLPLPPERHRLRLLGLPSLRHLRPLRQGGAPPPRPRERLPLFRC